MSDRARQFMPFDALKGLKESITDKEKIVISKKELAEDAVEMLEYKLEQLKKGMMVKVIYYKDNEYLALTGMVANIDTTNHILEIVKTKIPIDDIYDVISEEIEDL